jgi:tetratricopeptide (TPR) repeat protein
MKSNKKNKPVESSAAKKNKLIIYLFFLLFIPFVLYIRVVNFQFSSLDDSDIITATYNISGDLNNIKEAFTHDAFMSNSGDAFYRPMQTISFMLDAQIGGLNPWIYHLSNLLFHILTVIALFFFLKKIGIKEEISFLLSIFFSIHPLLTNAVAWIPARGDLLFGLFSLLSFITFLEYFENRKTVFLILHSFVFLMAVFSKETTVLLPVLILFYLYFIKRNKFNLKEIVPFLMIWGFSFLSFYILRQSVVRVKLGSNIFGIIPFIKNLPTIPITFGKFFIPYNLSTLPLFDTASLVLGILLLIVFIVLAIKYFRVQNRILLWGAVWFLAFTVPPMLLRVPIADYGIEYFDYRAYFPVIGILIIIGFLANELPGRYSFSSILKVTIPILLIYGTIALILTPAYSDPLSFFNSAINANSKNALAVHSRGGLYRDAGDIESALSDFNSATKICSTYSNPYVGKGDCYRNIGDNNKAVYYYSQALMYDTLYKNINNLHDNAYLSLSAMDIILKKYDEALVILKKGSNNYPGSNKIFNNLGYVYSCLGKNDSAIVCFNRAIEIEPNAASYYYNRANSKYQIKDFNGSLLDINKAVRLEPGYKDAYLKRGILKIDMTDYFGAITDLNMTLSLDQESGEAYYYRGNVYSKMNKPTEAEKDWAAARKLGFVETTSTK